MPVAAFDTLKYAKQLKDAGIPEKQAEAQTAALADALHTGIQDLATKSDLRNEIEKLRQELKGDMAQHRQETKSDIEQLRQEVKNDIEQLRQEMKHGDAMLRQELALLKWMIGALTAISIGIFIRLFFFKLG